MDEAVPSGTTTDTFHITMIKPNGRSLGNCEQAMGGWFLS